MRTLLVGRGYWGDKLYNELVSFQNTEPKVVTTSNFHEYQSFLQDPAITHVIIATPVATHYSLTRQALMANKHVMCEKNFTIYHEETEELCLLAQKNNLTLLVNYIYTFNPILKDLYIEKDFSVKITQYGKFRDENVLSMLGSHVISIAAQFDRLSGAQITVYNINRNEMDVILETENRKIELFASRIRGPEKIRQIEYNNNIVDLQYPDGINKVLKAFYGGQSNIETILTTSRCIKSISEKYLQKFLYNISFP